MRARLQEIVVDCLDAASLASFWGALLDAPTGQPFASLAVVGTEPLPVVFQQVPEPKSSPKNRLHLDVEVADLPAAIASAVALGARQLGEVHLNDDGGFVVMADPEDNEFCLVLDADGAWSKRMSASLTTGG